MITDQIDASLLKMAEEAEKEIKPQFERIDKVEQYNADRILSAFIENSVGKTTCRSSACVDHEERMEGLYKSQQTKGRKAMVS